MQFGVITLSIMCSRRAGMYLFLQDVCLRRVSFKTFLVYKNHNTCPLNMYERKHEMAGHERMYTY